MNSRSQVFCVWAGILCPIIMFIGLTIAGFFPPQSPTMTANEVAAFYQQHANSVRVGMIFVQIAGALYAAISAVVSAQMRRIEHRETPVLSYAQLALGASGVLFFVLPALLWVTASFNPERAPEITQAFHSAAYLIFVGGWAPFTLQEIIFGLLIISDKSSTPIFPRWLGFLNIWIGLLIVPAAVMPLFKIGPFAWDGVLAYWLPGGVFSLWFYVVAYQLLKAVKRQAQQTGRT